MDIIPDLFPKSLTKDTTYNNYLLFVDTCYKIPRLFRMENITTEEAMYNTDMFQSIFGKLEKFGWWNLEQIHTDSGTQFISKDFQESLYICVVKLTLPALDDQ